MVDTQSTAAAALKIIRASRSQNTSDTSFRKECENYSANNPIHDEGDDAIVSHQKSMFLVQSHLGQEEGRTKMVEYPVLKIIGASSSQNTSDTSSRKVCEKYIVDKPVYY